MTSIPAAAPRAAVLLLVLGLLAIGLASPAAADRSCTGAIGAERIDDTLVVPDGASCTLNGTVIDGNVLIGRAANLTADGISVGGNIQDDNNEAGQVTVRTSSIGGNIQLEDGRGAIVLEDNTVDGDVQPNANTGGVTINRNTIEGNLQCQANNPAPTGSGNVVRGDAEDQCSGLTGTTGPSPSPTPTPGARETSRLSGATRIETAVAISQESFPQGSPVVYLARADAFADALAGGTLTNGPILLVPSCGDLPAPVAAEIRRLGAQRVTALGGPGAVCDALLTAAANA
jgi:hypothetical protein